MWYRGLKLFHQLFATHRPFYLTEKLRILILQSNKLYSAVLLAILFVSRPTGAPWHCFASSIIDSWELFCHIGQLHKVFFFSQRMLTHFPLHWFRCAVMFGAVTLLSRKLVTLAKLSSDLAVAFSRPALSLILFDPVFWCLKTVYSTLVDAQY